MILKTHSKKKLLIWSAVIVFLTVFSLINNKILTVSEYTYTDPRIKNGFRIVHISDLHNARFGSDNKRLMTKIRELGPDMIALTGDLVDSSHTNIDVGIDFCKACSEICPTYYVTGNHEHWLEDADRERLFDGIRQSGTVILDDEYTEVTVCGDKIRLCGLDDDSLYTDKLSELSKGFDDTMPTVLLAHEPQYFEDYCRSSADLVLTGHAHGGQIRLPFVGGVIAPDQGLFPKYYEGEFVDGNTHMIISRGLGNSTLPVRVFDPPEIVCVDIKI